MLKKGDGEAESDWHERNRDELERLYRTHRSSLERYGRRLLNDSRLAEELVQETWLRALEGHARCVGPAGLVAWIYGILKNLIAKHRLTEQRRARLLQTRCNFHWLDGETRSLCLRFTPEELLCGLETQRYIYDWLPSLPRNQRQVLLDRVFDSAATSEPSPNVNRAHERLLMFRARSALSGRLKARQGWHR